MKERVLILAPIGRDAQAAARNLADVRIDSLICLNTADLLLRLEEGGATALVTEEALLSSGTESLERWVTNQPPWSDFPFIILTSRATSEATHAYRLRLLRSLGNVSLLERPLNTVTLMSTVQAALRARRRHYEIKDYLLERDSMAAQLEDLVRKRTRQIQLANRELRRETSERKQAEAALQQAQKMEMIGQMTGGVAHDFNNLLTAVLGNLELATRRASDEKVQRYLEGATQAAKRGAKLTGQLLAFSRTQRLKTESVDLNAIVTAMSDLLFTTIGSTVRIETFLQKGLWPAVADPNQIESVILNLAVNARDAMPDGGRLTISTSNVVRDDPSKPYELGAGDYIVVSVADSGTGMTEEVLAKAFEPFYTTKPVGSGTGLGLSQVYGIAKQTGGTVSISTKVGHGTTMKVYLPRSTAQATSQPAQDHTTQTLRSHEATILVVDDDVDVRELAVSCLESLGYLVKKAEGGQAAIDLISAGAPIDLILIDVAMPEVNGVQAIRAITKIRPGVPFLYMTGYVGRTSLDPSEHRVLKKPFTIAELAEKVEELLFPDEGLRSSNLLSKVHHLKPIR
ncbi:response regulator [Bradyrhizobium jicamae]|uniref:ATP-binding protein n=1 Tax=Bradyrhizobium jicamae TaxID=280332 RepID=UPI001BA8D0C0|nr:ATP-binding protein [Bradyrhizobium jicamae]MBR0755367.1 response regulator [Bradyrhizobium jicamae]